MTWMPCFGVNQQEGGWWKERVVGDEYDQNTLHIWK
jgi:hypothetical protein